MNTSEVLNRAADLIEERGWGRGNLAMRMDGSPICLEGGIAAAMGMEATLPLADYEPLATLATLATLEMIVPYADVAACPAYAAVKSYLGSRCRNAVMGDPDANAGLWAWNDTVASSASEVIEVLRAAAVIEAARETEAAEVVLRGASW